MLDAPSHPAPTGQAHTGGVWQGVRDIQKYYLALEAGQVRPDAGYVGRLTELAEREHFLTDWQLVGSMVLVGDLESARADIATLFRTSLERTSRQLME